MKRKTKKTRQIEEYDHSEDTRLNNPEVGISGLGESGNGYGTYAHDPHIDPELSWAGKHENTVLRVPNTPLHVHERISAKRIVSGAQQRQPQGELFQEKMPLSKAVEFYKHPQGWQNRLIAGDSALVMNSLLQKESMHGKVQMVYFDPPYGIKYGSNFQPFTNKRDVKDGKDEDLTQEPEMIRAFRDTWQLGIHSYLTYLRDRITLARELLHDTGSIFVQISDENVHRVRCILDEVFGAENFVSEIILKKTSGLGTNLLKGVYDIIVWYSKDKKNIKYRKLFQEFDFDDLITLYTHIEIDKEKIPLSKFDTSELKKLIKKHRLCRTMDLSSSGLTPSCVFDYEFKNKKYKSVAGKSWKTNPQGMKNLELAERLDASGRTLRYLRYSDDFPVSEFNDIWEGIGGSVNKVYVVQTSPKVIQRCLHMTTDPGDLVLDITCGSGTTAFVAEQWGRRWMTCDTSRVALALAKQRLLTATFPYYKLKDETQGLRGGFVYKEVPHITLKSIANDEPPATETLYDQAEEDKRRVRVCGPFTVEALPSQVPKVASPDEVAAEMEAEASAPRFQDAADHQTHVQLICDELASSGIRGKGGQRLRFAYVQPEEGNPVIHAVAETQPEEEGEAPRTVYVHIGPRDAQLSSGTASAVIRHAKLLSADNALLLFLAYSFDPHAREELQSLSKGLVGFEILLADINADLQTADLKRKEKGSESFWLIGQPDVALRELESGEYQVEVRGYDYFDFKKGKPTSGEARDIAMWMLDEDYDGRSLFPAQVFFPQAGRKDGWSKLAKNLKAELDPEKMEAFHGTVSLPFARPTENQVAVKIIDTRGIEMLRILRIL